jgi:hypothetical protein
MHSYRKTATGWMVGLTGGREGFRDLKAFTEEAAAAEYACWLNGGPLPPAYYRNTYLHGTVATIDTALHLLLSSGGDPEYNTVVLTACQVANRSANKDCVVTLYDGNDNTKALGFVGCPALDARSYDFAQPILTTPGNDLYCASADALTTIHIAAQGYKIA